MVSWSSSSILADFVVPEYYFDLQILSLGWTFSLGFRSTRPDLGEVLGISSTGRVHRLVFFYFNCVFSCIGSKWMQFFMKLTRVSLLC